MPNIAYKGSQSSHGGTIISSGASKTTAEGKQPALLGDSHSCPIHGHGTTPIVTASSGVSIEGKKVARVGDTVGCGAVITQGLPEETTA